jgi:hypothetical protein
VTNGISHTTHEHAARLIARGWSLIPVHGMRDGRCTCGGRCGQAAGKHPVRAGWTSGPPLSTADAWSIWAEDHPEWNVGVRTGAASGFFVLDIDPKADGLAELGRLIERHEQLPATYAVRTGSGGRHYYFRQPETFDVRNNQHRLAPGIDVRGTGGMVVAPPSVSGVGPYEVVADVEVAPAPEWLLELLSAGRSTEPVEHVVVEDLPAYSDLPASDQRRLTAYAASVINREAAGYAAAPSGTGNAALYGAACNSLEVAQSPWNLLTAGDVVQALEDARERRIERYPGGGQEHAEFLQTVRSAAGRVVGQGRAMPPDPAQGVMFDPPSSGSVATGDATELPAVALTDADRLRALLMTASQVAKLPPPVPLVLGLLDKDSEAWMIGKPGCFKSFVALDLAARVGQGTPWQGRRVHGGPVLYLVAEGASGMSLRVRAWEDAHGPMGDGVIFLPCPVQSADPRAWRALVEVASELSPVLVIIDTQARVTVGLDESGSDMGVYVEAVRQLRVATSACVLTVHHIGRRGNDARGSSMIDGAQGTEIRLERLDEAGKRTVVLHMDKQKDQADGAGSEVRLALEQWSVGLDPDTGREISSLYVSGPADPFVQPVEVVPPWRRDLPANQAKIVDVLAEHVDHEGATTAEIRAMIKDRFGEMSRPSFGSAFNALKDPSRMYGDTPGPMVKNGTLGSGARWALASKVDVHTL